MEYVSITRTSGIETTTGNITVITKNTVVTVIEVVTESEVVASVIVKHKWLEIEIPIKTFREDFEKA